MNEMFGVIVLKRPNSTGLLTYLSERVIKSGQQASGKAYPEQFTDQYKLSALARAYVACTKQFIYV